MEVDFAHKIGCRGNVPRGIEKSNFGSFTYGQSSTNPADFVKIRPVDVEIIVGIVMSVFFCLFGCLSASISPQRPNFTKTLCLSPLAVARSSSGGVAIRYVLPVLRMTSYLQISGHAEAC